MITKAKRIAAFAALSFSCAVAAVALTSEAQGSRSAPIGADLIAADAVSQRIDQAFAAATDATVPAKTAARSGKGDRLSPACGGTAWPAVRPGCLVSVDGKAVPGVSRTVTVEYRTGKATSTLVRMPVALVASR